MPRDSADLVIVGAGAIGGWASYFAREGGAGCHVDDHRTERHQEGPQPAREEQPRYQPREQTRATQTPFSDMPSFNEQDMELPAFLRRNVTAR